MNTLEEIHNIISYSNNFQLNQCPTLDNLEIITFLKSKVKRMNYRGYIFE